MSAAGETNAGTRGDVRLAVIGSRGRMGQRLCHLAEETPGFSLASAHDRGELDQLQAGEFDVAVEFSFADAVPEIARHLSNLGKPWVSGTTGISPQGEAAIDEAAQRIPVLWAPNLSLGVTLLRRLVQQAAALLPDSWEMELVERHHSGKRDAPSGTARALAQDWLARRGGREHPGRSGMSPLDEGGSARPRGEVGIHSVRLPRIVGEHQLIFGSEEEQVELIHRALDRDAFVRGALEAARWMVGRPARRYSLEDWADERMGQTGTTAE